MLDLYWVWWCTPVISVVRRLSQEDHLFEASMGYSETTKKEERRKEGREGERRGGGKVEREGGKDREGEAAYLL